MVRNDKMADAWSPANSPTSSGMCGDLTVTIEAEPHHSSSQEFAHLVRSVADFSRAAAHPPCRAAVHARRSPRTPFDFPALRRGPAAPQVTPGCVLTYKPMPVSTPDQLITVVRRSRLLGTMQLARVKDYAARRGAKLTPEKLAQWMVKQNLVTVWQAERLLAGVSSFFLGNYKFLHPIAEGAMGVVFKAQHSLMGRTVAIKVLSKARLSHPNAVARFAREVQAVAALDHPNIVTAYDAGQVGQTHYLVMEYIDGIDLHCFVEQCGQIPLPWACELIRQVALGLHHAHSQGMVHRDIKPANILVTWKETDDRPVAKILDLGLALIFNEQQAEDSAQPPKFLDDLQFQSGESHLTQAGTIVGTPDYLAPEQITRNREVDARSDIFGLGCTLFKLLTGQLPYGGPNLLGKLHARISPSAPPAVRLRTLLPDADPRLDALLARMLERDPEARPQSALEVAETLALFAQPPHEKWDIRPRSLSDEETGEIGSSQLQYDPLLRDFLGKLDNDQSSLPARSESDPGNHPSLPYRRRSNMLWGITGGALTLVLLFALVHVLRLDHNRNNVWPGNSDGVAFVWAHRTGSPGPSDPISQILTPRGGATFYDDQTLAFSGKGAAMIAAGTGLALQRACRLSDSFTFEAWITPHQRSVPEPLAIASLNCADDIPNWGIYQRDDMLVMRLRTSVTPAAPEIPLARLRTNIPQHVLISYGRGDLRCYVDGRQVLATSRVTGSLVSWQRCTLIFGQEDDRDGWQGWLQGIAIRSRFIDKSEAVQLYALSKSWQTGQSRTAKQTAKQ